VVVVKWNDCRRKFYPYGFRLGVIRDRKARWYAEGVDYSLLLSEDQGIRGHILSGIGVCTVPRWRAEIEYVQEDAYTFFGRIGVKVRVYRGDLLPGCNKEYEEPQVA